MKITKLTKKESDIMETLWNSDKALSSSDIIQINPSLNVNTVQTNLRNLNKKGYIKVDGVGFSKNSITRQYTAVLSQAEYLKEYINDETNLQLTTAFIKEDSDLETLDYLESLIKKRRKNIGKTND